MQHWNTIITWFSHLAVLRGCLGPRDKPVLHNQSDGGSLCCMNISHRDLIIIDCHKNSHSLHLEISRPKSV